MLGQYLNASCVKDPVFVGSIAVLSLYVCWYIWAFHVCPRIRPNEPRRYPYLLPFPAHGIAFFCNSERLIDKALRFFRTNQPFALRVGTNTFYVLTDPFDVSAAYRNTSAFSFDVVEARIMRACGCSRDAVKKLFEAPVDEGYPNPSKKHFIKLCADIHKRQLHPGEKLKALGGGFVEYFEEHLHPTDTSLSNLCSKLIDSAQVVFFGHLLGQIDPEVVQHFKDFDDRSWQVLFQLPRVLSRRAHAAKDKVIDALAQYVDSPGLKEDAAWEIGVLEEESRRLGLKTRDTATVLMIFYWAINANTPKGAFWLLSHILHNPALIPLIRAEIAPAFDGSVDINHIMGCPLLKSVWLECLRHATASTSVRFITKDAMINGYHLRAGNHLLIPYRKLHFNPAVFGNDAESFNPRRFLDQKGLAGSSSWQPFGGGQTLCPGRFIAQQSILVFVAMLLHRFDLSLAGPQRFPRACHGRPVLGIMPAMDDVSVLISERKVG